MYKVQTVVNRRTVRTVETATPFGALFEMIEKDHSTSKINGRQMFRVTKDLIGFRQAGYPANLDTGTPTRRYKITKV